MRFRPFPAPRPWPTPDRRAPRAALPPAAARLADVRTTGAALPPGTARPAGVRATISRVRATPTAVDTLARDKLDGGAACRPAACQRAGVVRGLRTGSVAALQRRVRGDARRR